jgi:hypothetical protein
MDSSISTFVTGGVDSGVAVMGNSLDNDVGFISVVISVEQAVKITKKIITTLDILFIEGLLHRFFRITYLS